jgi:hypothetical protein
MTMTAKTRYNAPLFRVKILAVILVLIFDQKLYLESLKENLLKGYIIYSDIPYTSPYL